jgi:hypothetical protein
VVPFPDLLVATVTDFWLSLFAKKDVRSVRDSNPLVAIYALYAQRTRAGEISATNANLLTARILDSMV